MVRELSAEKRAAFLSTALRLFARNGIQNTSTAEIARAAGTAAGTLFLYFPTKRDLVNELALWIAQEEAATIYPRLDPALSVKETFLVIWEGSIRWLLANMDAFLYSQQIRDSVWLTEETAIKTGETFRFYYEAIQKGFQEKSIKAYPADLIGGYLYQDIVAMMQYIRLFTDSGNVEQTIQQGFEIFWNGISIR